MSNDMFYICDDCETRRPGDWAEMCIDDWGEEEVTSFPDCPECGGDLRPEKPTP